MKKGLLCGLTMEYADFEESCPSYKVDTVKEKDIIKEGVNGKPSRLIIEEITDKPKKILEPFGLFSFSIYSYFFCFVHHQN